MLFCVFCDLTPVRTKFREEKPEPEEASEEKRRPRLTVSAALEHAIVTVLHLFPEAYRAVTEEVRRFTYPDEAVP